MKRDLLRIAALDCDAVVHIACRIRGWPKEGESSGEAALREKSHKYGAGGGRFGGQI